MIWARKLIIAIQAVKGALNFVEVLDWLLLLFYYSVVILVSRTQIEGSSH